MTDKERFEGLKKNLIEENEKMFGKEIRGAMEETVAKSSAQMMDMDEKTYNEMNELAPGCWKSLSRRKKRETFTRPLPGRWP
jgi:hypothetical protein